MPSISVLATALCTILVFALTAVGDDPVDSALLQEKLDSLRGELNLVAVGATVLTDGEIEASAVSGTRRQSSDVAVTVDDKWHLGSVTKSMTATVIGRLVERGELSWDMSLPEMLPTMAPDFHASWNEVTLHHVLTHSAGIPANFPVRVQFIRTMDRDELHQNRREELAAILAEPAQAAPGKKMRYSNVGYTLAGFIAAEKAGTTWEALMEKELFEPLQLKSAGFGAPRGEKPFDQPWGHQRALFFRTPMDPNGLSDNSPVIGPAGIVHMSMSDLAKFGWEHLRGESSDTDLLKQQTFRKLHAPLRSDYACGWVNSHPKWSGEQVLWHNGSNTMWYSLLILVPSKNAVFVFVTNDCDLKKVEPSAFQLGKAITELLPDVEGGN